MYQYYKLVDQIPVGCNHAEWAKDCGSDSWLVKAEEVENYLISTVFVGINFNPVSTPPLLFETAIINSEKETEILNKYSSYENAELGHKLAVTTLKKEAKLKKAVEKSE